MNHPESSLVVTYTENPQGVVESLQKRDGETYDHARDGRRLAKQHNRIFAAMRDGRWRSLATIKELTGDPEASISARLRDLRKPKFGSHTVNHRHVVSGLWEYQLVVNPQQIDLIS